MSWMSTTGDSDEEHWYWRFIVLFLQLFCKFEIFSNKKLGENSFSLSFYTGYRNYDFFLIIYLHSCYFLMILTCSFLLLFTKYIMGLFPSGCLKSFSFVLVYNNLDVTRHGFLLDRYGFLVFTLCIVLRFLEVWVNVFHEIWEFSLLLIQVCFPFSSLSFPSWTSVTCVIGYFWVLSHISLETSFIYLFWSSFSLSFIVCLLVCSVFKFTFSSLLPISSLIFC